MKMNTHKKNINNQNKKSIVKNMQENHHLHQVAVLMKIMKIMKIQAHYSASAISSIGSLKKTIKNIKRMERNQTARHHIVNLQRAKIQRAKPLRNQRIQSIRNQNIIKRVARNHKNHVVQLLQQTVNQAKVPPKYFKSTTYSTYLQARKVKVKIRAENHTNQRALSHRNHQTVAHHLHHHAQVQVQVQVQVDQAVQNISSPNYLTGSLRKEEKRVIVNLAVVVVARVLHHQVLQVLQVHHLHQEVVVVHQVVAVEVVVVHQVVVVVEVAQAPLHPHRARVKERAHQVLQVRAHLRVKAEEKEKEKVVKNQQRKKQKSMIYGVMK